MHNILFEMKLPFWRFGTSLLLILANTLGMARGAQRIPASSEDLSEYFALETSALSQRCLSEVRTLEEWKAMRETYRAQLREMLGLEPPPQQTELRPVVTDRLEQEEFVVEKLHFQAMPRLYVTANLYLPRRLEAPAPAILYACGHARMVTNGVSCGNKTGYQHHGAWFARNGYVCLMIDSLQLGEIEGVHHGTYREGQWWWNSRGYTPAGVEAWFGIRALDYLCSRPEVDKERIGMTGRSGGGSYTWTVAALDDRVKVAAPVAGITDLRNQVVDGVVQGHCDCMFFVNTYRWDFPQLAALLAPRPLLIANSDKDTIFPLDGVVRLHSQTRRIYALYGATNKLGLLITEGPHADTQELQVPVFRWFNRFLKQEDSLIEMAAKKFVDPAMLRAFDRLPADQLNTCIQETFVPAAQSPVVGTSDKIDVLRQKVFAGWPRESRGLRLEMLVDRKSRGLRHQVFQLGSQPGVELKLHLVSNARAAKSGKIDLTILDSESRTNSTAAGLWLRPGNENIPSATLQELDTRGGVLAFFAPRAVEPIPGITNKAQFTNLRRRYMLLGQTLDSMRVWDIRCAIQAIHSLPQFRKATITVHAKGEMGVNAAYAALFEPEIKFVRLESPPASHMVGPDYLNVLKVWDIPQVLETLGPRAEARVATP